MPAACCAALLMLVAVANGDPSPKQEAGYRVRLTDEPAASLLAPSADAWAEVVPITWGPPAYRTTFRALWSAEEGLVVRFESVDPDPWSTLTERDDQLWNEEVVEMFIDPDGDGRDYVEIEISPANVVCDLLVASGMPRFQADIGWDFSGLTTAVSTLRGPAGEPIGWTATARLPWNGFGRLPAGTSLRLPPDPGDEWRFNVFRIKRPGGPDEPDRDAIFAAWSPVSGASFHEPAAFRPLVFVE